jgi:hypothetical protein
MAIKSAKAFSESSPICPALPRAFAPLTVAMLQNFSRRNGFIGGGELAHFGEQVQLKLFLSVFADGCKAVGAEAKVDAGPGQLPARKLRMAEIIVAARAMHDVDMSFGQQFDVAGREQVDVDGQQIFAEQAVAGEMRDGRAEAAIGVVAFVALEPVEHFAACAA